jgi:hypothetical protein
MLGEPNPIDKLKFPNLPVKKNLVDRHLNVQIRAIEALQLLPSKMIKFIDKKAGTFKEFMTNKVFGPVADFS